MPPPLHSPRLFIDTNLLQRVTKRKNPHVLDQFLASLVQHEIIAPSGQLFPICSTFLLLEMAGVQMHKLFKAFEYPAFEGTPEEMVARTFAAASNYFATRRDLNVEVLAKELQDKGKRCSKAGQILFETALKPAWNDLKQLRQIYISLALDRVLAAPYPEDSFLAVRHAIVRFFIYIFHTHGEMGSIARLSHQIWNRLDGKARNDAVGAVEASKMAASLGTSPLGDLCDMHVVELAIFGIPESLGSKHRHPVICCSEDKLKVIRDRALWTRAHAELINDELETEERFPLIFGTLVEVSPTGDVVDFVRL